MFEVVLIVFILLAVGSSLTTFVVSKYTSKVDQKRSSGTKKSLEHSDCVNEVGKNCFHEYEPVEASEYDKVCKNCGHRNAKKDHRCSVCGNRSFF